MRRSPSCRQLSLVTNLFASSGPPRTGCADELETFSPEQIGVLRPHVMWPTEGYVLEDRVRNRSLVRWWQSPLEEDACDK